MALSLQYDGLSVIEPIRDLEVQNRMPRHRGLGVRLVLPPSQSIASYKYGRHGCTGINKKNEIAVTETQELSTMQPDSHHPASSSPRVPCSVRVADYSHFRYGMVTPLGALVGSSSGITSC